MTAKPSRVRCASETTRRADLHRHEPTEQERREAKRRILAALERIEGIR